MSYLTENPWPGIILLVSVAVVAFLTGSRQGRAACGLCLLLAVGLFLLERWLVSPAEEVERQVETMLQHFKDSDLAGIQSQISADSPELLGKAENGLNMVQLDPSFHLRSNDVTIEDGNPPTATAMVRANGTLTLRQKGGLSQYIPTYWRLVWHKEQDAWKLKTVARLNPGSGQELDIFAAQ